jgi:ABC-type nitrate/sulfonate/bicarbonate transport system permease component
VYNDDAIERTVRAILVSLATIILLVPIIIMFFISRGPSLIVLVVCTALFSMILAVTTDARNHEVMMAAAAYVNYMVGIDSSFVLTIFDRYGAVLIVFLGRG